MAIAEGVAALNSLRSLYEIAKDVRNSNDPEKLRAAAAQMFDLAISAREQTAALQDERNEGLLEIGALQKKLKRLEEWDKEISRYRLQSVSPGTFVYVLQEEAAEGEPPHWLCPACFQDHKKAILQRGNHGGMYSDIYYWNCPSCKTQVKIAETVVPSTV